MLVCCLDILMCFQHLLPNYINLSPMLVNLLGHIPHDSIDPVHAVLRLWESLFPLHQLVSFKLNRAVHLLGLSHRFPINKFSTISCLMNCIWRLISLFLAFTFIGTTMNSTPTALYKRPIKHILHDELIPTTLRLKLFPNLLHFVPLMRLLEFLIDFLKHFLSFLDLLI